MDRKNVENLDETISPLFLEVRTCVRQAGPALNQSIKWKTCLVYDTSKNHIQTMAGKGKIAPIFSKEPP